MCPGTELTYSFGEDLDISDDEIVQLYAFQREFGSWTSPIDGMTGVLSTDVRSILEIPDSLTEVGAMDIVNAVLPEDRPMVVETMMQNVTSQKPFEYTYRVPKADGTVKLVRTMGDARRREDGTIELYGVTFTLFPNARFVGFVEAP